MNKNSLYSQWKTFEKNNAQYLLEAQNYDAMFTKFLNMIPEDQMDLRTKLGDTIGYWLDFSKNVLKRNDRVVWFLRHVKMYVINDVARRARDLPPENRKKIDKEHLYLSRSLNVMDITSGNELDRMEDNFRHYLGMDIRQINEHVWSSEAYGELLEKFEHFSEDWKLGNAGTPIRIQSGDKMLIKFDGGRKAWWLLNRGACADEKKSMAHCGNIPTVQPGERILSFRTKRATDGEWVPHLTFILDGDGLIGEMKGYDNKKPEPVYHPYIVELLKHEIVAGIKGGGFQPENNFSLADLDDDVADELLKEKPELGSLMELFRKEGFTDRVKSLMYTQLRAKGFPDIYDIDAETNTVILAHWDTVESFARANMWLSVLSNLLSDPEDYTLDDDKLKILKDETDLLSIHNIHKVLRELDYAAKEKLGITDDELKSGQKIDSILSQIKSSDTLNDIFVTAIIETSILTKDSLNSPEFIEFIRIYLSLYERQLENYYAGLNWNGKNIENDEVRLEMDMPSFLRMISEVDDEYTEYESYHIRRNDDWLILQGGAEFDEEDDDFLAGLDGRHVDIYEFFMNGIKIAEDIDINSIYEGKFNISEAASKISNRLRNIRDENQLEFQFEGMIRRLKMLAGLN